MIDLKRVENISAEVEFLRILDAYKDDGISVSCFTAPELEAALGVSHNTLKKHLRAFRDANVIKFKLKPFRIMLNPSVFDFSAALTAGDIKALQGQYNICISD